MMARRETREDLCARLQRADKFMATCSRRCTSGYLLRAASRHGADDFIDLTAPDVRRLKIRSKQDSESETREEYHAIDLYQPSRSSSLLD